MNLGQFGFNQKGNSYISGSFVGASTISNRRALMNRASVCCSRDFMYGCECATGATGPSGTNGSDGATGATGATGPSGSVNLQQATYYANISSSTSDLISNVFNISNLSTSNFFGTNNYFTIRYTYTSFSADLLTYYSSTGNMMIFPQRINNVPNVDGTTTFFGYDPGTVNQYNFNNNIAGLSATFNFVDPTFTPYNRQYFNGCPTQGLNSGYASAPNSLYLSGFSTTTSGDSSCTYNINILSPGGASSWNYEMTLEVMQNPYDSSTTITLLPSYSLP